MVRERQAWRRFAAQCDPGLPPTLQLEDGLCRLVKLEPEILRALGQAQAGERPVCPKAACAIREKLATCGTPVEVEIGSGLGRFLLARATRHPDTHFIGIEQERVRVARIDVAARKAGLTNVSLIRAEAMTVLEFCLPDASVQAVYLFFPDPWPKPRHHKHRIFQRLFLDHVHRVLIPGGWLHCATDHEAYFDWMMDIMAKEARFKVVDPLVRSEEELTDFELKFMANNKRTQAASWRKHL